MNITGRKCTVNELHPTLQKLVQEHLIRDDPILFCSEIIISGKIGCIEGCLLGWLYLLINIFTGEKQEDSYRGYVITEHKVIFSACGKSKGFGTVESMNLVDIINIKHKPYSPGGVEYAVVVLGPGEGSMEFWLPSMESQSEFINVLQRAVDKIKGKSTISKDKSTISDENTAIRLKKLSELLNQGLITEEEYNQKRNEILNQL